MGIKYIVLFVFLSFVSSHAAFSSELTGKVVGVHDGDTVTILTPDITQVKIRLSEIDAPELDQPYGAQSKKALSDMIFNKQVRIMWDERDRYGRTVGKIYQESTYINSEMVRLGDAWVYRKYSNNPELIKFEDTARNNKAGLWGLQSDQVIPPWEWRHGRTAKPLNVPRSIDGGSAFACGNKTKCGQMTNCAEAKFYLANCGLTRIDGDHDGVPCESICR